MSYLNKMNEDISETRCKNDGADIWNWSENHLSYRGTTALIDRYRYEDNGQHWLTLTMTLSLEIGPS